MDRFRLPLLMFLAFCLVGGWAFGAWQDGKFPKIINSLVGSHNADMPLMTRLFAPLPPERQNLVPELDTFAYYAPGNLVGTSGVGPLRKGIADWTVYADDMLFPIRYDMPAFLNSQIYGAGGSRYQGHGTNNQCAAENYSFPWRDNFCERRSGTDRESLNCPSRAIHQGVDIRGGTGGWSGSTCARMAWGGESDLVPVVAVESGRIEYSKLPYKYVVKLITGQGRIFRYMHLEVATLVVEPGTAVTKGDVIGYLSNDFGRSRTTHHLHFEISENVDGKGFSHVSPYMSLVRAYERDRGLEGVLVE